MAEDFRGPSMARVASLVLKRSLGLRRGKSVFIETYPDSLEAAETLAAEARELGIRPVIVYSSIPRPLVSSTGAKSTDSTAISPIELAAVAAGDGYVALPASPDELAQRDQLPTSYREALFARAVEWNRTLAHHAIPSALLLTASATEAAARHYGVSFAQWRREGFRGSLVDPRAIRRAARRLSEALHHGRRVTIIHPNGTHLELGLAGRRPILDDGVVDAADLESGRVWTVIPPGLLIVAVDERVAEGRIISNRPSRHRRGIVNGLHWTFRNGKLDRFSVEEGRELFETPYRKAGRERNRPALLSIGLNPELRDFPLAEDQELGVLSIYVGNNDDLWGRTRGNFRESAILRQADLLIDDRALLKAGRAV